MKATITSVGGRAPPLRKRPKPFKQAVANLTGNKKLKREGKRDELKGNLEGAAADVKGAGRNALKDAKRAIKDASD